MDVLPPAAPFIFYRRSFPMTPLRQRTLEAMQVRNLAINTEKSYTYHVALFARNFDRSPELLTPEDIRTYQVYLTNEKKLSPRSIIAATAALRLLYTVTLSKDWNLARDVPLPKEPQSLPIILSRDEVLHFGRQVELSPVSTS
jgi:integrase/recombinase XerD